MQERFDLVAMGEAMVEFNQRANDPSQYLQGFGGDTSNAIIAAARQGARCAYLTRVGDDAFGEMLLNLWRQEGVDTSGVAVVAQANTGIYFVTHGAHGHAFSYRRAGSAAATMGVADLPSGVLERTQYLLVSGISQAISSSARAAVAQAAHIAKRAGARLAYDPNLRLKLWTVEQARACLLDTLRQCDEFLPGLEEMQQLTGLQDPREILAWSHAQGPGTVVLKMGAAGVLLSTQGQVHEITGHPVHAVDATGAGDCFNGNYLSQRARGANPVEAARWAAVAAALSTTGYGAVKPLPTAQEVSAALQARPAQVQPRVAVRNPVVHFEMPYDDAARVAAFYTRAFGWETEALGEAMGGYVLANTTLTENGRPIEAGTINGGFFVRKPDWPAQFPAVVIAVSDMAAAMARVADAGGSVLGEPMHIPGVGRYVAFLDTEGNRASLLEPMRAVG